MRSISIMYDSLNRKMLSAYGNKETITPNFERLAKQCAVFDGFYCGSLPCMPARREIQTGRYNFLHRSWGPMEPYDQSVFQLLGEAGIYTHFVSDHDHYWQEGGLNYHNRFTTYEFIRGQEGDSWKGDVLGYEGVRNNRRQDRINRQHMQDEEQHPHVRAFRAGMEFLEKNWEKDNWHLHLEYFDPHEPFFAPEKYRKMYDVNSEGVDWPPYSPVENGDDAREYRKNYCALLTMCDTYLGYILDFLDEHDMWKDTLLTVNTDHGFLLGEHGYFAKNYMPTYEEISHLPFFLWDPESGARNVRKPQLSQTIDIAPTLLDYHHLPIPEQMQGRSMLPAVRCDEEVRSYALFGSFGKHVNITDGRYVYMRAGRNENLNYYTIMPTHIFTPFTVKELRRCDRTLTDEFSFTDGVPLMRIPASSADAPDNSCYHYERHMALGDLLFDLKEDPDQTQECADPAVLQMMKKALIREMMNSEAPKEQYDRLGIDMEEVG